MKNFMKAILFLVPIGMLFCLFVIYEPCNYWGLKPADGDCGSSVTILRKMENQDCQNIILCSSKLVDFSPEYLKQNGWIEDDWVNLSLTGASIKEECEMFWNAVKKQDVKKVLFTVAFWDMYLSGANRFTEEAGQLSNSWMKYFSDVQNQQLVYQKFLSVPLQQQLAANNTGNTLSVMAEHTDEEWREIYRSYVERIWEPVKDVLKILPENIVDILEVVEYCRNHEIELYLFSFPMQKAVYDFLEEAGLYGEMDFYKKFLSLYTPVYDMEYKDSAWTDTCGLFMDGCHINGVNFIHNENPMMSDIYKTMFERNGDQMQVLDHAMDMKKVFSDRNVFLSGNSQLQVYASPMKMEKDSMYVIKCSGVVPKNGEILYMDFFSTSEVSSESAEGLVSVPLEIGGSGEYFTVISTRGKQSMDVSFRIVYQGMQDLSLESLEVYKAQ